MTKKVKWSKQFNLGTMLRHYTIFLNTLFQLKYKITGNIPYIVSTTAV